MHKRKKSRLLVFALIVFFAYLFWVAWDQQRIIDAKKAQIREMKARVEAQARLNEELKKQKEELTSDESIEKIAREKLGMVKRGERLFVDINR